MLEATVTEKGLEGSGKALGAFPSEIEVWRAAIAMFGGDRAATEAWLHQEAIERKHGWADCDADGEGWTDRGRIHQRIAETNAKILDFQAARARLDAEIEAARAEQQREERVVAAVQADPAAVMDRYRVAYTEHRDAVTAQAERLLSRCEQQRQQVGVSLAAERASEPEPPRGLGAVFKQKRYETDCAAWRGRIDVLEHRAVVLDRRVERLTDYADERRRWGQAPSAGDQLADARLAAVQPELIEAREIAEPLEREQKRRQSAQELEKRIEKRMELGEWQRQRYAEGGKQKSDSRHVPAALARDSVSRHDDAEQVAQEPVSPKKSEVLRRDRLNVGQGDDSPSIG